MREIEFLPEWYPAIQRRYRWVALQACVTVVVVLLMAGYAMARRAAVRNANQTAMQTQAQINLSRRQLVQLNEKLKFEDELRQQDRIVARLGLGVETTRLVKALEEAMPPEMALTNLKLETEEQPLAISDGARRIGAANQPAEMDRRLKVVVDGVAPTEIEAVTMMGNLLKVSCFENVAIQLNEGKMRDGHIVREFEVTFEMDLNPLAEGRP